MYVQWENETDTLQVVQQYSDTQDLVMVMKPIGVNNIFNVAPPKVIADTADTISSDVSSATMLAQMTESDWFSPHYVTGYT